MRYDIKRIEEDMKKRLSPFRYHHTMLVAKEAVCLAKYYQIEEQKAVVASLLHDIAKEYTKKESDDFIDKYQLPQGLKKEEFKNIIHADIGAEVAKERYRIEEDIYKAIKYHTIGNENMDLLSKIIFVADKTGREKLSPKMQEAKKVSYENINDAICLIILIEKERLKQKGLKLHPNTVALLKKIEDKKN